MQLGVVDQKKKEKKSKLLLNKQSQCFLNLLVYIVEVQ